MSIDSIRFLRGELRRSLHGPAWHGPALLEALADVTASEAFARPLPGAHSIAEIALHSAGWLGEVTRRLRGSAPAMPADGDWPEPGSATAKSWRAIVARVRTAGETLDVALADFPEARLLDVVGGGAHDAPLGSGVRYAVMLSGAVQHNVYHAGQIVLLSRALREG